MKTSWNDTADIEAYLLNRKNPEDKLLFEAKLLLQGGLREKLAWQQQVYDLVNCYSRKKLKEEIEAVHNQLFTDKKHRDFRQKILALFLRK